MLNARDPFEMDDGFEDIPVVQKPVQTVNKVANTVVKQTAQQAKATAKAFLSQLYGSSSPTATDDDQQQADTSVDPIVQQLQKQQTAGNTQSPVPQQIAHHTTVSSAAGAQSQTSITSDEAKLEQTRRKLQQTHTQSYFDPTFGRIGDLEDEIRKEAEKRKQEDQQKEQEKEQEKQQMEELEQKKKEQPIAVTRAKNKAESNRGAAG